MRKIKRPEGMTDLESILEKNNDLYYNERWHPTAVSTFEEQLKGNDFLTIKQIVRKNIAYSLQYLEYVQLQLSELHLHSVIEKELYKTYIITAMGIIEAIFHHLVVIKGFQKKDTWEEAIKPAHTNVFTEGGTRKKYIITLQKELKTPRDVQMDFEYLINKVQEKKLLSLDAKLYPQLKRLKRVRNKVHLHIVREETDTDYISITNTDYLLVRFALFCVLTDVDNLLQSNTKIAFIRLNEKEEKTLLENLAKEQEGKNAREAENAQPE